MSDIYKKDGIIYRIDCDNYPCDPRDDSNGFLFVTWLRNYYSPDKNDFENPTEFLEKFDSTNYIVLKIHAYIHSGIHYYIAGTQYDDPWDSGFAGFMSIHKQDLSEYGSLENETEHDKAVRYAQYELDAYNAYCNGTMLDVRLYDENGNEYDSYSGYVSEDDILSEHGLTNEHYLGESTSEREFLEYLGLTSMDFNIPYDLEGFTMNNRELIGEHLIEYISELRNKTIERNNHAD